MASGVEMMMKALGIDPEEIKKAMFGTVEAVMTGLKTLNTRMESVDQRLQRIEDEMGIERPVNGQHVEILPPERKAGRG